MNEVDIDALISPEGEVVSEEQALLRSAPFMEQAPPAPVTMPSAEKRQREQLRVNALVREVKWYREQGDVYAGVISTLVRGKQWERAIEAIEEVKLFYKVFEVIERDDTDLNYRTKYIEQAIESYEAPADWAERWRLRAQMK